MGGLVILFFIQILQINIEGFSKDMEINLFLVYSFGFIGIIIILSSSMFFDMKFRLIPNKIIKYGFIFTFLFNLIESFLYMNMITSYVFLKLISFLLVFIFCLFLFSINLIGGGDGKIAVISFLLIPIEDISNFFRYFPPLFIFFLFLIINIFIIQKKDTFLFYPESFLTKRDSIIYFSIHFKMVDRRLFPLSIPYSLAYFSSYFILMGI